MKKLISKIKSNRKNLNRKLMFVIVKIMAQQIIKYVEENSLVVN